MALITTEHLTLSYEGMTVVSDISFEVTSGDYLCVVGENGSGKSTLIKALLSLKKPLSGSISFGEGLRRSEIGYLPQQTGAQKDFPASVYEVVLSGGLNARGIRPFYSKKQKLEAEKNMELMGITGLKRRSYRDLSGGQQQRVLLARALCATQKLLLLDEPVSGLDPVVTEEMYELIDRINKQGVTIIMVTHDMGAALKYARHVLYLHQESCFFGTVGEFACLDSVSILKGGSRNV